VVEVLLDGEMRDVLDLYGIQARVGEEPGEIGVEAAVEGIQSVRVRVAALRTTACAAGIRLEGPGGGAADTEQGHIDGLRASLLRGVREGAGHGFSVGVGGKV
jgi:hypothetical protein